ncbi:39373_t:CDS:1, partial [Gigaspora margarita]
MDSTNYKRDTKMDDPVTKSTEIYTLAMKNNTEIDGTIDNNRILKQATP